MLNADEMHFAYLGPLTNLVSSLHLPRCGLWPPLVQRQPNPAPQVWRSVQARIRLPSPRQKSIETLQIRRIASLFPPRRQIRRIAVTKYPILMAKTMKKWWWDEAINTLTDAVLRSLGRGKWCCWVTAAEVGNVLGRAAFSMFGIPKLKQFLMALPKASLATIYTSVPSIKQSSWDQLHEYMKFFIPPTWKVRRGHLVIGSSVCP